MIVTTPENWQVRQNSIPKTTSRLLAQTNEHVYYAYWLANNPYSGLMGKDYLDIVRGISGVLNSFSIAK